MAKSLVGLWKDLASCIGWGFSTTVVVVLLYLRNAVSSGVSAGGLSIVVKAGSTLNLIPDTLV